MAEPPYGEIEELLKKGQIIPFIGAGVNFGARPPGAQWDPQGAAFLPSGAELSRFLAKKSNFPSNDDHDLVDLAKVASYYEDTLARRRLRERLHDIFNHDFSPCEIHSYLAEASASAPLLIVTTNYDDLLEQAFNKAGRPFDLVIHPTDREDVKASVLWWKHGASAPTAVPPNELFIDLKTTTVIYKMHGTVDRILQQWDSYVITEDDYVDFLSRMTHEVAVPALFMKYFHTRNFLFMGYGLNDWNLRVVLRNIENMLSGGVTQNTGNADADDLRSWAIQFNPSDLEVELWNARNVKVYNKDINEFVRQMRAQGA